VPPRSPAIGGSPAWSATAVGAASNTVDVDTEQLIDHLGLEPHPEGGWYRQTWRDEPADGARGSGTAIYFLLAAGERSHWHRVDAVEVWHFYAGDPLELAIADGPDHRVVTLTGDPLAGEPQGLVPLGAWQAARTTGAWTLVGATVSPAFEFSGFELAEPDWRPDGWSTPGW